MTSLSPAELRNGLYVKPFTLLEVEQLWCGHREVWTASHGRATRYHVMIDGGVAACRSKQQRWHPYSVIVLGALIPLPADLRGVLSVIRSARFSRSGRSCLRIKV